MSDATDHLPGLPSTVVMMTDNEGGPDRRGRILVCDDFVSLGDSVAWEHSVVYTTCFFSSRLRRSDSEIFSLSKLLLLRRAPLEVVVFLRNKKTA